MPAAAPSSASAVQSPRAAGACPRRLHAPPTPDERSRPPEHSCPGRASAASAPAISGALDPPPSPPPGTPSPPPGTPSPPQLQPTNMVVAVIQTLTPVSTLTQTAELRKIDQ